jgi:rubredoxin
MPREMVWIEKEGFQGWACSVCEWKFHPSGGPKGESMSQMAVNFERQRDEEFKCKRQLKDLWTEGLR